jgi:hypothetical protein
MKALYALALVLPGLALAQGGFDGTWVADLASLRLTDQPQVYVLDRTGYYCHSCVPAFHARSDGTDQPLADRSYSDSVAVDVLGPQSARLTYRKAGKVTFVDTATVSADGATLTEKYEDRTGSAPILTTAVSSRAGPGPSGSHAISGSWHGTRYDDASPNAVTMVIHGNANGISIRDLNGAGFDARFGGRQYKAAGDIGHTMVTLRRIDERTIEETDRRRGKVEGVLRLALSTDGQSIESTQESRRDGAITRFTWHRQP